ncbi:MAG: hypothetical protein CUN55_20495, partial [Phototrophicales bacterium]
MASVAGAQIDCIECLTYKQPEQSPWLDALSIVAGPLALLGSTYFGAKYAYKTQSQWANAYAQGHQQCTNRFNAYLDYNIT